MTQRLVKPYSKKYIDDLLESDNLHKKYVECANKEQITLEVDGEKTDYSFRILEGRSYYSRGETPIPPPVLPLRGYGELWSTGWDIPTNWAIDAEGKCWKDGAHGGAMGPCKPEELISEAEKEVDKNNFRRMLGLPETHCCPHCKGKGYV